MVAVRPIWGATAPIEVALMPTPSPRAARRGRRLPVYGSGVHQLPRDPRTARPRTTNTDAALGDLHVAEDALARASAGLEPELAAYATALSARVFALGMTAGAR